MPHYFCIIMLAARLPVTKTFAVMKNETKDCILFSSLQQKKTSHYQRKYTFTFSFPGKSMNLHLFILLPTGSSLISSLTYDSHCPALSHQFLNNDNTIKLTESE